ncbi:hypothetical protein [Larkinella rosea]|uniref:Uncharacterized protein n=1 Tax=Larkinella rosea TaxID=2025312 RepID=A0A3P1BEI0_9BACT|nr:hypothetical protein [Larkinella rosea]RRA99477.1 hypothetical protein EHT25_26385 [Larkinella rosea]
MVKFDYLQLRTEAQYIQIDKSKFDITPAHQNQHGLETLRLSSKARAAISRKVNIPMRRIKVDIIGPYLCISVTAKILGHDYLELISSKTIDTCFENLVKYGILLQIDSKAIKNEAKLTSVEITNDFTLEHKPILEDYNVFAQAVFNPYQWNPKIWENKGFSLSKLVKEDKEFLSIYDKSEEMKLSRNRKLNQNYGPYPLSEGSMRAEAKLLSAKSIRNHFGKNSISDVLDSQYNPLGELFRRSFIDPKTIGPLEKFNKSDFKNLALATNNQFDYRRISDVINADNQRRHNRARKYRDVMKVVLTSDIRTRKSLTLLSEIIEKVS